MKLKVEVSKRPDKALLILKSDHARQYATEIKRGVALLQQRGLKVKQYTSYSASQTNTIIKSHAEAADLVILGGGDGTMNAAVQTLCELDLSLAVLPLGTANDLARTLQIPPDIDEAFQIIADVNMQRIDVATVNSRYFFNVAHIGLGSEVQRNLRSDDKKRWGFLSYTKTLIDLLRRVRPFKALINVDGVNTVMHTVQVAVGNGRHYGGGNVIDDECMIQDGKLYLVSIRKSPLWKLILLAPLVRFGLYKFSSEVFTARGTAITVSTRRTKTVCADGEVIAKTPVTFEVLPAALSVVVPAQQSASEIAV